MASFAFLVGGFWVLMNYIRNRTHVPRLQVELRMDFFEHGDGHYLLATCRAKNVGLSIIRLPEPAEDGVGLPGTALLIRMLPRLGEDIGMIEAPWEPETAAFDIFANHQFIEPGLAITEQKLIYQSAPRYDACWAQLRVSAHNEKWSTVAVAMLAGTGASEPRSEE